MVSKRVILSMSLIIISISLINFGFARDYVFENHAKSGVSTRVPTFFNCQTHSPGGGGSGTAEHGTVTSNFVVQNKCGTANEPTNEYWYTSNPGFKGTDTVTIPASAGTNVVVKVTVE